MNYLHNAIYSFMKDHGIKPFELFHIRCDIEKDYELYEKLRSLTVGYFDNLYEFHLLESLKERAKPEDESIIVTNILNGTIIVSPVFNFYDDMASVYKQKLVMHKEKAFASVA